MLSSIDLEAQIAQARAHGQSALDEVAGKAVLASFGIAVPASRAIGFDEDVQRGLAGLEPPFVLKVIAPGILHKSDVGGVRLGIANTDELVTAVETMRTDLRGRGIAPSGWLV